MVEILSRLFVKDYQNIKSPTVRRAYGMMVSIIGIVTNFLLAAGKLTVGLLTGSVSVQADAVNNLSDAGSSVISLVCFRISAKPADRDHPFGHARIEYVASMIVSFIILLIGFELLRTSAADLYHSVFAHEQYRPSAFRWVSVIILSVSILGKLFLVLLNRGVGKKIDSSVMRATAADSLSDVMSTAAVLAATLVAHFFSLPFSLDGAMGIVVSVLIMIAGAKILMETQNSILGQAPSQETVDAIYAVVAEFPEALGVHDLSVHQYGTGCDIASLHIEVDGAKDVFAAHDMIDNMERRLFEALNIRATIHMDPIVVGDPTVDATKEKVALMAATLDERITVHDFRMVRGITHSNLIFDLAVPFECTLTDDQLLAKMAALVRTIDPDYCIVAHVDRV